MSLLIPDSAAPSNLHVPKGTKVKVIDSDLYGICERVKEIDPNLFIILLEGDSGANFSIIEKCKDGVDRLVFRVKELDGRVIKKLQRLMGMDLMERLAELEKMEYEAEAKQKEEEFEDLYQKVGEPMRRQLWHDGFIDHRGKSYPTRGVKATNKTKGIVGHG